MLNELEKIRYKRHFLLEGWDEEKQEKIKNTTVFVAGAGGTGSPTITMLALLGVGRIRICDFDVFEESNKNRQFIHSVSGDNVRLGMNKAESAALTVHNINPNVKVEYFEEKFDELNVDEIVGDAQMIFDCVDRFKYKFILSDCAVRKNIPMLFYGIMDYNIFGYIFNPPETACFHCLFDERKINLIERAGCRKADVAVMSPTLFASAGIMMSEAVKLMIGYEKPSYNTFFFGFGKREKISEEKGTRAFRFWNTPYFNELSKKQGLDLKRQDQVDLFKTIYVPRNCSCPYCGGKSQSINDGQKKLIKKLKKAVDKTKMQW